jgi:hypothetical protein
MGGAAVAEVLLGAHVVRLHLLGAGVQLRAVDPAQGVVLVR